MKNDGSLHELSVHRLRLERLVGELLGKVDELDQSSKYTARPQDAEWHRRLASTCTELVALSEAVSEMKELLDAGEVAAMQRMLLKSTEIATLISERVRELKHESLR